MLIQLSYGGPALGCKSFKRSSDDSNVKPVWGTVFHPEADVPTPRRTVQHYLIQWLTHPWFLPETNEQIQHFGFTPQNKTWIKYKNTCWSLRCARRMAGISKSTLSTSVEFSPLRHSTQLLENHVEPGAMKLSSPASSPALIATPGHLTLRHFSISLQFRIGLGFVFFLKTIYKHCNVRILGILSSDKCIHLCNSKFYNVLLPPPRKSPNNSSCLTPVPRQPKFWLAFF